MGKEWLGVCDDGWGFADAMVVCRSLRFDYAIASIRNYASVRTTEGWNHVDCNGSENLLGDCTYRNTSVYAFLFADCIVSEGAGVTCGYYGMLLFVCLFVVVYLFTSYSSIFNQNQRQHS